MENTSVTFKAITDFVADLNVEFGETYKPVSLYNTLLTKTTLAHDKPVQKHIQLFKAFLDENAEVLRNADTSLITNGVIRYSDRVYIDLYSILNSGNSETAKAVIKHLATINACINPTENAMSLVKSLCVSDPNYDFITDIISTVTENIEGSDISDPMSTAMSLLSSGKLTNIFENMRTRYVNGTLDPSQLLKKVSQMYSEVSQGEANLPDIASIISSCTSQIQGM
jgi:translation elongation factor EF-Ts